MRNFSVAVKFSRDGIAEEVRVNGFGCGKRTRSLR